MAPPGRPGIEINVGPFTQGVGKEGGELHLEVLGIANGLRANISANTIKILHFIV